MGSAFSIPLSEGGKGGGVFMLMLLCEASEIDGGAREVAHDLPAGRRAFEISLAFQG